MLTPRQYDVARLVAAGLPRPEVGRRLRLSRGTIDAHLRAAYRRLGVHCRRDVAAVLLECHVAKKPKPTDAPFLRGAPVRIVGGRYVGRDAIWLKRANSNQVLVQLGAGAAVAVMAKFVAPPRGVDA